jgi:hypothetical protein
MWTSWLERTLGAHDAAEYVERRALRQALDAETRTTSPSPLVEEGRGEGAVAATKNDRREPPSLSREGRGDRSIARPVLLAAQ